MSSVPLANQFIYTLLGVILEFNSPIDYLLYAFFSDITDLPLPFRGGGVYIRYS